MYAAKLYKHPGRGVSMHITGLGDAARTAEADHHYCMYTQDDFPSDAMGVETDDLHTAIEDARVTGKILGAEPCIRCMSNATAVLRAEANPADPARRRYSITFTNAIRRRQSETYTRFDLDEARDLAATYRPYNNTDIRITYVARTVTVDRWMGDGYKSDSMDEVREVPLRPEPVNA